MRPKTALRSKFSLLDVPAQIVARSRRARVAAGALVLLMPTLAHADQFVLFDATFTYTWDDAMNAKPSKSHYYVNEANWLNKARPTNWTSPVNYRDGKVHIRAEVLEKPAGDQSAGWALCYIANMGEYGCPYTNYYTKTGVYERDVDMRTFWNNATIQWEAGVKQVDLVYTIDDSGSGHVTNFPDKKDLVTPTKVRISMIQVSSGGTYDPGWIGQSDAGAGRDAGTSADAAVRDASDAGTQPDGKGGSGGTGGTGTGGTTGSGGTGGSTTGGTGGIGTGGTGAGATGGTGGGTGGTGSGGTTGGVGGAGGAAATGGNAGMGGSSGSGGSGNGTVDAGDASGTADAGDSPPGPDAESLQCECSLARVSRPPLTSGAALFGLSLLVLAKRRDRARRR
jgi:hypothetical protein